MSLWSATCCTPNRLNLRDADCRIIAGVSRRRCAMHPCETYGSLFFSAGWMPEATWAFPEGQRL
eukprot:8357505-Pyramimonas_sp.AAC.1